ncbi:reverse transcriptase domain-containing protein [Tanacetum coccineum]
MNQSVVAGTRPLYEIGKERERAHQLNKKTEWAESDAALQEYCDKNYNQLLLNITEKFNKEKEKNEKFNKRVIKSQLNLKDASEITVFTLVKADHNQRSHSRYTETLSESTDSGGGHWKSRSKKKKSSGEEDDLGEVSASNHERKKSFPPWKQQEGNQKQNFKKGGFWNQQRPERKQDRFTLLTKTPKEIFALDKGKFKAPPLMTTPVDKRNHAKFFEFHEQRKGTAQGGKKGETSGKYKALAILMVQPWERVAKQRITQSFSPNPEILFLPLGEDEGTEGPMIIEAEIGGHCIHHMSPSSYNGIVGRPGVRKLQAVSSTAHGMLKLPVEGGVITLKSSRMVPLECAMVSGPEGNLPATKKTVEERIKHVDMTGVPRHIAKHRLNVREGCSSVRQKKRGQTANRNQAIQEEVGKLVEAGTLKEVHYHDWLSNPVMVKKHDDSWRMCVDFKDLNKACPKDGYLLPEIDWKMPFSLRNAGATYQHLVDKAFHKQIGRNLKVYVDELVIKSRTKDEIVRDIKETFKTLREINMKLNPKKCTFGVEEGMFLGYKVNTRGLKVCPDKKSDFHWTAEAEEAFKQMKQLIAELPMLVATMEKEELIVYLAAAKETILADFIVERPEEDSPDTLMEVEEELLEPWILFTDESSCTDGSGARLILTNTEGMEFTYALRFRFDATNNKAEYEALIARLRISEQIGVNLQANVDSRLVANQVNGTYVAKKADMIRYLKKVRTLTSSFKVFSIRQAPRSENKKADALRKIVSTSFAHLSKHVLVEELKEKSISEVEILAVVKEEGDTWITPIFEYLTEETLPADVKKARAVRRKSRRFAIINATLYKKSFLGPWLRCVGPLQENYVLREIHEGSCSMHAGTRSVVAKALRIGYYWPTMHKDARTLIRACQDCQVHKPVPRNPRQKLTPITSPWPFYK